MEKTRIVLSLNKDWSLHLGEIAHPECKQYRDVCNGSKACSVCGVPQTDFDARSWDAVNLPHDRSIKLRDENGSDDWDCKPHGKAWYRKCFKLPEEYSKKQLVIDFEGVEANATVFFNGSVIKRSFSGNVPFSADITDCALFGNTPNVLAVFIDGSASEYGGYTGAGIYRDVSLTVKNPVSVAKYGVFVNPQPACGDKWNVNISTKLSNSVYSNKNLRLVTELYDNRSSFAGDCATYRAKVSAAGSNVISQVIEIESPKLWSIDNPTLYTAVTLLFDDKTFIDSVETKFGFRTISFDAEKGFFLNGKSVKILGTCSHREHAGVGAAVLECVHEYTVKRLKEMGGKACRTAYGMVHSDFLDACDKLGMLVMDESPMFETSEEGLEQLRTMVLRDRNHPSVIMYSIFNEEPLQVKPEGRKMALHMKNEIKLLDPMRFVTGVIYGDTFEDNGAAAVLDVCGIDYKLSSYDLFREKHPAIPVIGIEATSAHGCCETSFKRHESVSCDNRAVFSNIDLGSWKNALTHHYTSGAFMQTDFDYLGEPPHTASRFGVMDACGFAKDAFYLYKALFSDVPYCSTIPSMWSFGGGMVHVISCTNCAEAELFLNGKTLGRKAVDLFEQASWEVEFEAGTLEIVGYNGGKKAASHTITTSGKVTALRLSPQNSELGDGINDALIIDVTATDEDGTYCPNVDFPVEFTIENGEIISVANGNPSRREEFSSHKCSLFCGRCQLIVRATRGASIMKITAKATGIRSSVLPLPVRHSTKTEYIESTHEKHLTDWRVTREAYENRPDISAKTNDRDMSLWEPVCVALVENRLNNLCGGYIMYRVRTTIPTEINGFVPTLHFYGLLGSCEVYINGRFCVSGEFEHSAEFDVALTSEMCGDSEILVLVKSNKNGGGICRAAVIR